MKNKKVLFLVIGLLCLIIGVVLLLWQTEYRGEIVKISKTVVKVELATTEAQKEKGLSGREKLGKNEGILFVYNQPTTPSFWMKGMKFSIDIIWIDKDKKIVDLSEHLKPESYPLNYSPQVPVSYVLEVPINFVQENDLKVGQQATFSGF